MVTTNYQLLSLKEKLSENLSSEQIEKTLNQLLMRSLRPAIEHTHFIEYTIVELIPYIFLNMRRRFSSKSYPELRDGLFSFIMIEGVEDKITLLSKQRLERSVFFIALSIMERYCFEYLTEMNAQLTNLVEAKQKDTTKLKEIEKKLYSKGDMYNTAQSLTFWLTEAYKFRAMIVEKYIRHAKVEAKKMALATNLQIDEDDLLRNLILAIFKAIDKYDSLKGTLTSYVNIWFMEAKTNYRNSHEYGVAYRMPTGQRKKLLAEGSVQSLTIELNEEIAENLEDASQDTLENLILKQDDTTINNLACRSDKSKIYCLINELNYTLTPDDIEIQRASMR